MKTVETHIAPTQEVAIRIQEYAVGIFKTVATKSAIKKAIKKNLILVNNLPISTATMIVGGETITLLESGEETIQTKLILKLEVVYEDDYLAIINKPAGVLVSGNKFKTVDNALMQNLQKSTQSDAVRPRPVHRLDYPTTGLLLVGKTSDSIQKLNQLFEYKKIQKIYYAITIGKMPKKGMINEPIDEKQSESFYKVIKSVPSKRFDTLNLVQLLPMTGRRHQLRKHLSGIGNPILGDQEYGIEDLILKGKGLYLHSSSLGFMNPFTQKVLTIESELPKRFLKIFPN